MNSYFLPLKVGKCVFNRWKPARISVTHEFESFPRTPDWIKKDNGIEEYSSGDIFLYLLFMKFLHKSLEMKLLFRNRQKSFGHYSKCRNIDCTSTGKATSKGSPLKFVMRAHIGRNVSGHWVLTQSVTF
jgi:hypothetical protein